MPYADIDQQRKAQREYRTRHRDKYNAICALRKRKLQEWFQEYKSKLRCSKCPENHVACLDFHHRDRSEKDDNVAQLASHGVSIEKILEEIAKCDVLCANCHRKLHYEEKNGKH